MMNLKAVNGVTNRPMKFLYVVRQLRAIADTLENDKNLETGDLEGSIEELQHLTKLIRGAMQYVGEKQ